MRQDSVTARAVLAVTALGGALSCDAVLGIQAYEAGPTDASEPESGPDVALDSPADQLAETAPPDVAIDTATCTQNSTRCSGNAVETCNAKGSWGAAVACAGAIPFCYDGHCTSTPPSCAPGGAGMTDCGASKESCCENPSVTGGTYDRTYTNSGSGAVGKADPATVSGFRLEKYLVTVGRFRQFVGAWNGGIGYLPPAGSGKHTYLAGGKGLADSSQAGAHEPGWLASDDGNVMPTTASLTCDSRYATWTAAPGKNEDLPINCVNWYEAYAFCIWDGGFLPSEAEYELAAAGGDKQREYPWGTAAPGTGSEYAIYGCNYPSSGGGCTGTANIAAVGTAAKGAGIFGQLDLAGDLAEWSLDWYADYVDPCTDCAYLEASAGRMVRGGYFRLTLSALLPPSRAYVGPIGRNSGVGFRCAAGP